MKLQGQVYFAFGFPREKTWKSHLNEAAKMNYEKRPIEETFIDFEVTHVCAV